MDRRWLCLPRADTACTAICTLFLYCSLCLIIVFRLCLPRADTDGVRGAQLKVAWIQPRPNGSPVRCKSINSFISQLILYIERFPGERLHTRATLSPSAHAWVQLRRRTRYKEAPKLKRRTRYKEAPNLKRSCTSSRAQEPALASRNMTYHTKHTKDAPHAPLFHLPPPRGSPSAETPPLPV